MGQIGLHCNISWPMGLCMRKLVAGDRCYWSPGPCALEWVPDPSAQSGGWGGAVVVALGM